MRRRTAALASLCLAACGSSAATSPSPVTSTRAIADPEPEPMRVHLIVPEAPSERLRVEVTGPFDGDETTLRSATAAVGAYRPAPFGEFFRDVEALDAAGAPLPVEAREDGWVVRGPLARLTYEIDAQAGEQALDDLTVANHRRDGFTFVSGYATFPIVLGAEARAHELSLELPEGWRVATALAAQPDRPATYLAASALELLDEPLMMGAAFHTLEVVDAGAPGFVHVFGTEPDPGPQLTTVAEAYRAASRSARAVGLPPMTRPYHLFVELLPPGRRLGWAMEHDHSTLLMYERGRLTETDHGFTYHVVHEVLHAWIPRRLYTRSLRPEAQLASTPTPHVWLAEGFEQYLAFVGAARSGAIPREAVLRHLARRFARPYEQDAPPAAISMHDHSLQICHGDHDHWAWQYGAGGLLALLLDERMRETGDGTRGLPEALAGLVASAPVEGIDDAALQDRLSEATGLDLSPLFARHVNGTEPLDVEAILARASLVRDGDAWVVAASPTDAARRFLELAF
jgi:predicted metalloprotease with PDZ domain